MQPKNRIVRQTIALTRKNFLIFSKNPITTVIRALLFPLAATLVFCLLKKTLSTSVATYQYNHGIATSPLPVKDLATAVRAVGGQKVVFVRNGFSSHDVDPVINGAVSNGGSNDFPHVILDEPNGVLDECGQSLVGASDCFAAVIFTSFNSTNVDYIIATDSLLLDLEYSVASFATHSSLATDRLLPLQWAINSQIGNFSNIAAPQEQPWLGYLGEDFGSIVDQPAASKAWFFLIKAFVAPFFVLILMGVVYHLSLSVAAERQSGVSELLAAQACTTVPRILSNLISFSLLYLPSWVICSVLMTRMLFQETSDIILLLLTVLAGLAITCATHLVASFFRKAQLAGLYTSTLMFSLSVVTVAFSLSKAPVLLSIQVLSFFFTPFTYSTLIGNIALSEINGFGFSLSPNTTTPDPLQLSKDPPYPVFPGYWFIIMFVCQILMFSFATYAIESWLWKVNRSFTHLEGSDDITVRATNISKTFSGKRRWYWPFTTISGSAVNAVENFNIEMKRGSVNFLLGPNGGGKTTTLKCIAGIYSMDVNSRLEISEEGLNFGVCPQLNVFWDVLTVAEHINIWRTIKTAAYYSNGEEEDDVLVECDLLGKQNSVAKTLSGGQQRKLQLAIAFVGGSKMCFIDEASSGLDPLSRRNIWNIISTGHSKRTILMTTHFLDEADFLADYISILYKGKMVCAGTSTALKADHGDVYTIRELESSEGEGEGGTVWSATSSADATRKVLELEEVSEASYSVDFPTLEQVFLRVTDSHGHTLHEGGDGATGLVDMPKELEEVDSIHHDELDLDVGNAIGFVRQVYVILCKRYTLIRHTWISLAIALAVPIIIAAAVHKYVAEFPALTTCQENFDDLRNSSSPDATLGPNPEYVVLAPLKRPNTAYFDTVSSNATAVGPVSQFEGAVQDRIFVDSTWNLFVPGPYGHDSGVYNQTAQALNTRTNASSVEEMIDVVNWSHGQIAFGVLVPTSGQATIFHQIGTNNFDGTVAGFGLLTNRIANEKSTQNNAKIVTVTSRTFRKVQPRTNPYTMPLSILLILGFVTQTSIAVMYPTDERVNNVRALQYCNGVSPAALWLGYLIFDMQIMIMTSIITFGLVLAGPAAKVWFDPAYILGIMLLFGIATYLGIYLLSMFIKKAAFAIAAALHMILFVCYYMGYIINQSSGPMLRQYEVYNALQSGLGLSSPGANLARAFLIGTNNFDVTCGKTGAVLPIAGSYTLYGGVYLNLTVQILFLTLVIGLMEYGSTEWLYKIFWKKCTPARLHYVMESGDNPQAQLEKQEKTAVSVGAASLPVLIVDRISKYFGKVFATENVSFDIASNEVLALIGPNGAGKTSTINMIRGIFKPDSGNIRVNGVNVLQNPSSARVYMGVCPQDDAIDQLTVRQTLDFYAAVKGLKNVSKNVDAVLAAFKITEFEKMPVKKLSGGTRRKLMVAIALLGNPKVLLLDEPTTGQDAGAKRVFWKVLRSICTNRAILLTTHSMEETEALATKVTILATRVLASGSLSQLTNEHGGHYHIRGTYGPEQDENDIGRLLVSKFGDLMTGLTVKYGEAEFELPHRPRDLGKIMLAMEGLVIGAEERMTANGRSTAGAVEQRDLGRVFSSYVIIEPTMEEVFMKVCQKASLTAPIES